MTAALAPGCRVLARDEEWLVRACLPTRHGACAVRVIGLSELVRDHEAIFLSDLDEIAELRPEDTELVLDDSPQYRRSRLFLESLLRRTPPTDDGIYLGHRAAMSLAPFQTVPAYEALSALRPRILIADTVGLGKTLSVGILLTELIKRGRGDRILVVALSSLLAQLQQELWTRFTIPLVRLDTEGLQRVRGKIPSNKNPFYYFGRAIISIDTLKNDGRYRTYLEQCHWDVIVIDECHHVANADTQRNRLAELLASTCDSLILTSATPHNGRAESFANLVNMLDPTAVADPSSYTRDEIKGLFVRRFKKDVEAEVGEHFRQRQIQVHHASASAAEEKVLRHLQKLTFHTLDQRRRGPRQHDILFATTLRKAFLSSPHACLETVEARMKRISDTLDGSPPNRIALEHDHTVLDMLRDSLLPAQESFAKLASFEVLLRSIGFSRHPDSIRVIVFSERIRTIALLEAFLKRTFGLDDSAVQVFTARMSDAEQMKVVDDFGKADAPVRVLLATDVASEGVNLHYYCHHVIHFDIPHSIITIAQRNGRIDRFGQLNPPCIYYLLTTSADPQIKADLRILEILVEKEKVAHTNIGDEGALLGLYDAAAESEYIQGALSAGIDPERIIPDAPREQDFLDLLMAGGAVPEPRADRLRETLSLYDDDISFARAAFDEITSADAAIAYPDFHPHRTSLAFLAPEDLQLRCRSLPREAIPKDWQFLLTADRERLQSAIADARRLAKGDEKTWPAEHLFWEPHPVAQWLLDKVMCRFARHQAPVIVAPELIPGAMAYLFQALLSNRRSQPVIAEWFAILCEPSGGIEAISLPDLLALTRFAAGIPNVGASRHATSELKRHLSTALAAAGRYLAALGAQRIASMAARLEEDNVRFRTWEERSLRRVAEEEERRRLPNGKLPRDVAERGDHKRRDIAHRRAQRERWLADTLQVASAPYLRVGAVFVGA
ncbi:MAG: DEAD/DEAH box helicase [Candidatus Schekmanbacteria bacterium]|nr:DEAD/DEAH box helicase [Candidatus Schekmanbacteria bacterium]